jgi:hypothetical protein
MSNAHAKYIRVSSDGKYGLTKRQDDGYHYLFAIFSGPEGLEDYSVGAVSDAANFELAIDEAEEERRVLLAEARLDFGF